MNDAQKTRQAIQADIKWGRVMIDWVERKAESLSA